MKAYIVLNTLT